MIITGINSRSIHNSNDETEVSTEAAAKESKKERKKKKKKKKKKPLNDLSGWSQLTCISYSTAMSRAAIGSHICLSITSACNAI